MGRAVAYMRARLGHPVSVAELAREARLSPYHFLRVFTVEVGRTPHRHLVKLRIGEAKRLLAQDHTVTEAALRCGFSSTAHFSAVFLRETGMRPSRWAGYGLRPTAQYTSSGAWTDPGAGRHCEVGTTPGASTSRPSK